jgi:hypothetical protein
MIEALCLKDGQLPPDYIPTAEPPQAGDVCLIERAQVQICGGRAMLYYTIKDNDEALIWPETMFAPIVDVPAKQLSWWRVLLIRVKVIWKRRGIRHV